MLARCAEAGLAFIAWAPLAKGFLTSASGALAAAAQAHGATPGQVALAWIVRRAGAFAIPGTASARHLEENVGALAVELTDDEIEALERDPLLGYRVKRLARKARMGAGRITAGVRKVGR